MESILRAKFHRPALGRYCFDGWHGTADHRQVERRQAGIVNLRGQLRRRGDHSLHGGAMAVPRGQLEDGVPGLVSAAEDAAISRVPSPASCMRRGTVVSRPALAVQCSGVSCSEF